MTDKKTEALKLADELDAEFAQGRISNHTGRKAAQFIREALALDTVPLAEQPAPVSKVHQRKKMEKMLFEDLMTIDSVLEELNQGDMPTYSDTENACKAFARIKQSTSPVLFTSDEVSLFLDAYELFVRESCPSLRLTHMRLEEKENLAQKLTFKMMCFISDDVNPDTAISHVKNALFLLRTIHFGNETKRSQAILLAAMRNLERALG